MFMSVSPAKGQVGAGLGWGVAPEIPQKSPLGGGLRQPRGLRCKFSCVRPPGSGASAWLLELADWEPAPARGACAPLTSLYILGSAWFLLRETGAAQPGAELYSHEDLAGRA